MSCFRVNRLTTGSLSVNQLKLRLHQYGPQQVGHRVRRRLPRPCAIGDGGFRDLPFGRRGRAAERGPEDVIDHGADGGDRAGPAAACRPPGGSRRFMFGSVSKMKNRTAGLSVDPISARALSTSRLPRNRVNPLPEMS